MNKASNNLISEIGPLAIGSRLRQVSDLLFEEIGKVYQALDIDLSARFFPLFYALTTVEKSGITELARRLRTAHPAVSQMVAQLTEQKIVFTERSETDIRFTMVRLSDKGQKLALRLKPIWQDIEYCLQELIATVDRNLLGKLGEIETLVNETNLSQAIIKKNLERARSNSPTELILEEWKSKNFEHLYYFERLTVEWFSEYEFKVEEIDVETFRDPESMIITPGGKIIFARLNGIIVGVVALFKKRRKVYELARMSVDKNSRGKKIGELLATTAIEHAKNIGGSIVELETNSKFKQATKLYEKLGFIHDETAKLHYKRADRLYRLKL